MKIRQLILGLIALSFIASLFAAPLEEIKSGVYGAETLPSLKGTGIIKLHGTTISEALQVSGSLIAQNAEIGTLEVIGEANLTNTTVKNTGSILGSLQAVRSTFETAITILSQKAVFTATRLEGITVQKDTGFKGKQIIELKQGTIVNGPIHFESGKGEVIVYPGSQVLGLVSGGKIVKKS